MINSILSVSESIQNGRSIKDILAYAVEEMGELATEVNIETGYSSKEPGKDGIVGEAIDVIICLVDLIKVSNPTVTERELQIICNNKLLKWLKNQPENTND